MVGLVFGDLKARLVFRTVRKVFLDILGFFGFEAIFNDSERWPTRQRTAAYNGHRPKTSSDPGNSKIRLNLEKTREREKGA